MKVSIETSVHADLLTLTNMPIMTLCEVIECPTESEYSYFINKGTIVFIHLCSDTRIKTLFILGAKSSSPISFSSTITSEKILVRPFQHKEQFTVSFTE
jgi:hypothetical protein